MESLKNNKELWWLCLEWQIKKEHDQMSIREYLQEVHSFSRRIISALKFEGGQILVNGLPKTVRYCLTADDLLTIVFPPETKGDYLKPEEIPLDIVYEDDDILIINKEAGMATMPSANHRSGTVANGLLAYYEKKEIPYTIHVVTRLDRDTSGLMLIAKHRYSHSLLAASQSNDKLRREYKALVEGRLETKQGIINAKIARKENSIIERTVSDFGKEAITYYEVEAEYNDHSLVNIVLETGRTHQIRVHFSHIGHPLIGDDLYGHSNEQIKRHALHCEKLSFEHPLSKQWMSFHMPIPNDMKRLIATS